MKFWQKIYLFSLLLVILTIGLTGVILIQNLHNKLMETEIEKSITEAKLLGREIETEDVYFQNYAKIDSSHIKRSLDVIIRDYIMSTPCEGKFQLLDADNHILFTDIDFPEIDTYEVTDHLSSEITNFIIKEIQDKQYLYICSLSQNNNLPIKILYAKNITAIYAQQHEDYLFFAKIGLWICCIFSIFMFFISRMLTKPIEKFAVTAQKIAAGNYLERVHIRSKDEFSLLAVQFNKMAETIENKITELEHSNQEKEVFINNFTHELKTPLTSIIGFADLLRTSTYDEKLFYECTDYIYNEGKHLEQIAFKMMDLIYAKSQQLSLEPIDLLDLINSIEMTFKQKLESKQINLIVNVDETPIIGDKILIKMLLSNVIDNAIKASYPEGSINIYSKITHNQSIISIQDYGIGISPIHLDKICQPFYIVDPSRTKQSNGAGIGLAICKKIAEVHQGKLEIESQLASGTKVSIILKQ